ncbi:MAG: hypothetical protein MK212_17575 [Saprospiraceae bacterium]|nr:hypothetical protein [Saprospiraceae bacterium]
MKRVFFLFIVLTFLLSSCAVHTGLTNNHNLHSTDVVLSQKNFNVIARVQGESEALYVFGIGGHNRKAMIAEARADMLSKADILGGAKAVINETVEMKRSTFLMVQIRRVIVSAHVIEFTE